MSSIENSLSVELNPLWVNHERVLMIHLIINFDIEQLFSLLFGHWISERFRNQLEGVLTNYFITIPLRDICCIWGGSQFHCLLHPYVIGNKIVSFQLQSTYLCILNNVFSYISSNLSNHRVMVWILYSTMVFYFYFFGYVSFEYVIGNR